MYTNTHTTKHTCTHTHLIETDLQVTILNHMLKMFKMPSPVAFLFYSGISSGADHAIITCLDEHILM